MTDGKAVTIFSKDKRQFAGILESVDLITFKKKLRYILDLANNNQQIHVDAMSLGQRFEFYEII